MEQQLLGGRYSHSTIRHVIAGMIVSLCGVATTLVSCGPVSNAPPPTATPVPYPPSGWKLAFDGRSLSQWDGTSGDEGSCRFANNVYQVQANTKEQGYYCTNHALNVTDFAVEAQVTIVKGNEAMILFRFRPNDQTTGNFYSFAITPDGTYTVELWKGDTSIKTLAGSTTPAIHSGLNQPNVMAVVARGNTFQLYVNNQLINTLSDTERTYDSGSIGLGVYATTDPTEANFNYVKVWEPPS